MTDPEERERELRRRMGAKFAYIAVSKNTALVFDEEVREAWAMYLVDGVLDFSARNDVKAAYGMIQRVMSTESHKHFRYGFFLGRIICTTPVYDFLDAVEAALVLSRHHSGDWSEMDEEDQRANQAALENGERILSAYTVRGEKLYVITAWDRSTTTVMFAREY